ncbi:MAG TPA: hypothetical protein VF202_13715 [Trueperaceae bacterium]
MPTADLEREAARLQFRIIHGVADDLDIENFYLIMMELGSREMFNTVLDPRDGRP